MARKSAFDRRRAGYLYIIGGEVAAGETAVGPPGDAAKLRGSTRGVAELILVDALEFQPVGVVGQ